jgi:hypothetical protein
VASIFTNKGNTWIYVSYINKDGKGSKKITGYAKDNPGGRIQAKLIAQKKTLQELQHKQIDHTGKFAEWVGPWIETKYGDGPRRKFYVRR